MWPGWGEDGALEAVTELGYAQEELVVESIALTLTGDLGLDSTGYSIPYLTSWSDNGDDLEVIEACADLIDRIAKRIEDVLGEPPLRN